jgi:hypothetical protein
VEHVVRLGGRFGLRLEIELPTIVESESNITAKKNKNRKHENPIGK